MLRLNARYPKVEKTVHPISMTEIKLIKQTISESLIKLLRSRLHFAIDTLKPEVLPNYDIKITSEVEKMILIDQ